MNHLTRLAYEWASRCFGSKHVMDRQVRSLRLAEEAVELCHAEGVDQNTMIKLIDLVYAKPKGEPRQEIGGVIMTAAVYCEASGLDFESTLATELSRVLKFPPDYFKARNKFKLQSGLIGSSGE